MPGWDEAENQWRYRVKDPGLFQSETFRTKKIDTGVSIIIGRLKGETTMTTQSYRFDKDKFPNKSDAQAWYKEHAGKAASDLIEDEFGVAFGETIKTLDKRGRFRAVGALGVLYGNESQKDMDGEFFTKDTYFGSRKGDGVELLFHHGIPLSANLSHLSGKLFTPVKMTEEEAGLFYSTVFDMAETYDRIAHDFVEQEKLRYSSGALPPAIQKNYETGEIESWPIVHMSLEPTAAEPRLPPITTIKSLKAVSYPDLFDGIREPETVQPETPEMENVEAEKMLITFSTKRKGIWIRT